MEIHVMIQPEQISVILEKIAKLLELKGENPFKVKAYRAGAEIVESYPGDLIADAREGKLQGVKGIGDALRQKIHELATTGKLEFYENLKKEFPESLFELFEIQGLGHKKVKLLYDQLGITSIQGLREACESGKVSQLQGFGAKTASKLLEAIAYRDSNQDRFHVDEASQAVEGILDWIKAQPEVLRAEAAGSWRRGKETVGDLDFIVAVDRGSGEDLLKAFCEQPFVASTLVCGSTKASVRLPSGLQCDVRAVSQAEYPFALAYFTGSKEHNVHLRQRALKKGWTLNEYRLSALPESKDPVPEHLVDESSIYRALGLNYIEPELRENQGEIEASESGILPKLVTLSQVRGTFHNHTTASDGKHTLREMAEAAMDLGLQYLGIADHSKSSFQANGLSEARLLQQIEEIAELNREFENEGIDFRLLSGSEVDILKHGKLDFSDELLSRLDYCVASIHQGFTASEAEMTQRIVAAMQHPAVTMIGHPSGRLLLRREAYALNYPELIQGAAETNTILEINANPWRLDMDWRWWRLAKEKGVKASINPDAHHQDDFQFLFHGVRIARKGWLTQKDVLNTLPWPRLKVWLDRPKSDRPAW